MSSAAETRPLKYWFWWPIRTTDTFEADTPPVMQIARNIYAPLVSEFVDGKAQGMIAKSWTVDETGKVWRFKIRNDLTFEDGTSITPEIVLTNIRRILWLTRKDGLVLNSLLTEVASWNDYSKPLSSVRTEGDDLVFTFNKRPINLFEAISQPMYGIAHPKCFDANGKWKDPFCSIASGQYRIERHEGDTFTLRSRHIFPEVVNAPDLVEIHCPSSHQDNVVNAVLSSRGDLTVEHSFGMSHELVEQIKQSKVKQVAEPPVRMHFVHLNASKPGLTSKAVRQSLRDLFQQKLTQDPRYKGPDMEVNGSFIPKGGVGYKSFPIPTSKTEIVKGNGEELEVLFFPIAGDKGVQSAIEDSVINTLQAHGFKLKVTKYLDRFEPFNRMRRGDFDIIVRGTGILTHNPYGDLRMMFMSKVGAMIPDVSKKIPSLIEQAEAEQDSAKRVMLVEDINTIMHDDASIITFAHSRLFYLHQPSVNLDRINLFVDPIEFRGVGWQPKVP